MTNYASSLRALVDASDAAIWVHPDIEPLEVPGKGAAFRATRPIAANTELLRVRPRALLNTGTVKPPLVKRQQDWSAHQLLAYFVASLYVPAAGSRPVSAGSGGPENSQQDVVDEAGELPTMTVDGVEYVQDGARDVHFSNPRLLRSYLKTLPRTYSNMPVCWPEKLVPPDLEPSVAAQRKTLDADYKTVTRDLQESSPTLPIPSFELFKWAWLTVNTRCLYISLTPHAAANLTLAPAIDLLNHTDDPLKACTMKWDRLRGMSIRTGAAVEYAVGEEVCITYGHHPNAFLLREYGFVLAGNAHDCVDISRVLLDAESDAVRRSLHDLGYDGEYTLAATAPHVSFRTTVAAVAISYPNNARLVEQLAQGFADELQYASDVQSIVTRAIKRRKRQLEDSKVDEEEDDATKLSGQLYSGWISILDTVKTDLS